jgi:hypothetical protein
MEIIKNDFDHIKWKHQFEIASAKRDGFRELRIAVFQNTVTLVQNGGYYVDDVFVPISSTLPENKSEYFDAPDKLSHNFSYQTQYSVINAENGYCLLKKPFDVAIVTVPAINGPDLVKKNGKLYIDDNLVEPTKEKIRTILRIAGKYNHDCLVLGAFGCGAFANPPNHMAELFTIQHPVPILWGGAYMDKL